ncbi:unnamed protein product [Lathyrus sativus]|nr:unnamed protein product [Lathyrus sativus]
MHFQRIPIHTSFKLPAQFKVAHDKLVIASGAEPSTFGIKGVKEHAFFREVNQAQEIRKRLLLNLMLSENPGISEEEKKRLLYCVVIGGVEDWLLTAVRFGLLVFFE